MKALFVIAACLYVAAAVVTPELVEKINAGQNLWRASMESPTASLSQGEIDRLLGIKDIEAMWAGKVGERLPLK